MELLCLHEGDKLVPIDLVTIALACPALGPFDCAFADSEVSQVVALVVIDIQFDSIVAEFHADLEVFDAYFHVLFLVVLLMSVVNLNAFDCKGRVATPNDPKLSDGGAWRGSCVVERSEGIRVREKGGSDETGPS